MINEGKNADMLGKHSLRLDEEGLVIGSSLSEARTNYGAVEEVVETKEYIYIYVSSISAHIIPVRSFESVQQKDEWINKLNHKVKVI